MDGKQTNNDLQDDGDFSEFQEVVTRKKQIGADRLKLECVEPFMRPRIVRVESLQGQPTIEEQMSQLKSCSVVLERLNLNRVIINKGQLFSLY